MVEGPSSIKKITKHEGQNYSLVYDGTVKNRKNIFTFFSRKTRTKSKMEKENLFPQEKKN